MNSEKQNTPSPDTHGAKRQKTGAELREDRQKAALKANMARRKMQAKARMGQNTDTEYWSLVYLLGEDKNFIGTDSQVNAVLKGSDGGASTTAGVFNEKHKYIALSGSFEASNWVKGILFLHELRHAHAYYDGQYKDAGQHAHWIEETEVWLYEFGLFEFAKPQLWQNLVAVTKNSLTLTKDMVSFPPATTEMKDAIAALDAGPTSIDSFISTVSKAQALYEAVKETENEGRAKNELAAYLKNCAQR